MGWFKSQASSLWKLSRMGYHLSKIVPTGSVCEVDGTPLHRNNSEQILRFCSRACRRRRHNKRLLG